MGWNYVGWNLSLKSFFYQLSCIEEFFTKRYAFICQGLVILSEIVAKKLSREIFRNTSWKSKVDQCKRIETLNK